MYTTEVNAVARSADGHRPQTSQRHVPGEPGLWVLLFGDIIVFTVLFTVYLHQRGVQPELFAESQGALNQGLGAANTLVLLTSSILVVFATYALRRPELHHLARPLILAGTLVGSCFVAIKTFEYHQMIGAGITPSTNEFFMFYFVVTGLHLVHLIIGLIVLTFLSALVRKTELTTMQMAYFEAGACYWHMVDLLWIVIFPLIFLVG